MAREIIYFLLVQSLICKVLSSYAQPTIQQYLQLTAAPHNTHQFTVPAYNNGQTNQVITRASTTNHAANNQARPPTGLPSFSALALPNLVSGMQNIPELPKPAPIYSPCTSNIDAKLLNNLAIALQLLIVSNILNSPPAELPIPKSEITEIRTYAEPTQNLNYAQYESVMPNSNFVGSSGFAEPNLVQNYNYNKPKRTSMSLMSPYEALSPSSPYSDPILSQYGTSNPRMDFQSPYSVMDKDFFPMNDLF